MHVVHASWSLESALYLWAEDSLLCAGTRSARAARPRGRHRVREHPYACPVDLLRRVLVSARVPGAEHFESSPHTVVLPSVRGIPSPSPELPRRGAVVRSGRAHLVPWRLPAFNLMAGEALDALLVLGEARPANVVFGRSFQTFSEVARFALELVARGRVIPELVPDDGAWRAAWRPVLRDAGDLRRLRLLASALPGVCRAGLPDESSSQNTVDTPEGGWSNWDPVSAYRVVEDMLETFTDAFAADLLQGRDLLPERWESPSAPPPAPAAWLIALTDEDPYVFADHAQLRELRRNLVRWTAPLARALPSFRTAFAIEEPPARRKRNPRTERWQLRFLLQANDQPELTFDSAHVWNSRAEVLELGGRVLPEPQEHLLGDLGRASRLFEPLERALEQACPTHVELNRSEAWSFLHQARDRLEGESFGVIVPKWWDQPTAHLGTRLRIEPVGPEGSPSGGRVRYTWELTLGGQPLTLAELRALADHPVPLVWFHGRWVEVSKEPIERAARFFEKQAVSGETTLATVLRIGHGIDETPTGLPVVGIEAAGPLATILGSEGNNGVRALPVPDSFEGSLRPYQARGLGWLDFLGGLELGACLADDMGLGKTIQVLALLARERERIGASPGPTLVICPMSVVGNWAREAQRFTPQLDLYIHHGRDRASGDQLSRLAHQADLVLTTYNLANRDREELEAIHWYRLVLDEAQNVKNNAAQQTRAVRALSANHRLALTGTPVENRLTELWSIMEFLNPGLLGRLGDFKRRFAIPIERFRDEAQAEQLRRLTGPFILRRLKTDERIIEDLPEKMEIDVPCGLSREQAGLYESTVEDMLMRVDGSEGIERKGHILTALLRLKQICDHPALLEDRPGPIPGRSGKVERLEEILEEVYAVGDRCILFTQFKTMGQFLQDHLQEHLGREVLFLHGGTSRDHRDAMVARFQGTADTPGEGPGLFILSLRAGGTGLNLTAATHVVHFDRWWNPAVEDQATDRAFRIGQRQNVQVRRFICEGTVEERIAEMIRTKKELADRVVESGEKVLTELSTDDLARVLRLSGRARTDS